MAPDFHLEDVDPRADLFVMTNVAVGEFGFLAGEALRQRWFSGVIQRTHSLPTPPSVNPESPWQRCMCPDGSTIFIKFLSLDYRLLSDLTQTKPTGDTDTMPAKKTPPPRKGASKTAAAAKPAATPPSAVKPVAASPSTSKTAIVKDPKPEGNTKWLLDRLKSQATAALSTGDNRGSIREGLKTATNFTQVRAFFERAGIDAEKFEAFLVTFFNATINRPQKG